jgi:hypothetical protein
VPRHGSCGQRARNCRRTMHGPRDHPDSNKGPRPAVRRRPRTPARSPVRGLKKRFHGPRGEATGWRGILGLWLALEVVVCSLGPVLPRHPVVATSASDCGCPVSCACRAEGCCSCRSEMLRLRSRCTCSGPANIADGPSARWEMMLQAAPTVSGPHHSRTWGWVETSFNSWLLVFELDHPPRPDAATV